MLGKVDGRYRAEVIADASGKYCGNGLRFDSIGSAEEYARELMSRWTLVRSWRVVDGEGEQVVSRMGGGASCDH